MSKKAVILTLGIVLLIASLGYLFSWPTALRQIINMKRAEKHLSIIKSRLETNPIFKDIRLRAGAGLNGCIMVIGTVPANKDIIELKNIITNTNPPVMVDYAVSSVDNANWVDLSDGLKCLVELEKNIFAISETITVDVFIRNSTDKEIMYVRGFYYNNPKLGPAFRCGIDPVLKDSNNTEIKSICRIICLNISEASEMKPGESEYFSFNLTDCYHLDKTGKYSFYLSFKKGGFFADGQSNTVGFEIADKRKY
ncbi:MAG: hypothetical protein V1701_04945 [Planctomycetota bacterium]